MQGFIPGFVGGILYLTTLSQLLPLKYSWFLLAVPVLFVLLPRLRFFTGLMAGFLWAALQANLLLAPQFPPMLERQELLIQGTITTIPMASGRSLRFDFQPVSWDYPDPLPDKLRLSWYNDAPQMLAGETWQLLVRLKRPYGFSNPGSQDYERSLFSRGINATGYVRKSSDNLRIQQHGFGLNPLRQKLAMHLSDMLGEHEMKGLVLALTLGIRSDITKQQWEMFTATGTNHLIAISGLHIGLVSGFWYWIVLVLWKRSTRLCHRLPAQKAGAIAALAAGLVYAAMAGFSVPTQRASIMLAVFMLTLLLNRSVHGGYVLLLALFLVLLLDPMAVLSPGLWLSFAAVAIILWIAKQFRGDASFSHKWKQWIRIQLFIAFGLFPVTILFFQRASLIAPVANLLAVPLTGFFIVPLLLAGVLVSLIYQPLGELILILPITALGVLGVSLDWMQQLPAATTALAEPSLLVFSLAIIGVFLLLGPVFYGSRMVAVLLLLPLVFNRGLSPDTGYFKVDVLDVGQGLAAVIRTANHTMIYDIGPKYSKSFNAGSAVVVPYLRSQGVSDIDLLMVTHADSDHRGGLEAVLDAYTPVRKLTSNITVDAKSSTSVTPWFDGFDLCYKGQSWEWDGVDFTVLHPFAGWDEGRNNGGCVLKVSNQYSSMLFAADIEKKAEEILLNSQQDLQAEVLLVPHHGSKTSSSAAFLEAVGPQIAVVTTGYLNHFGFPKEIVVNRYIERGIEVKNTAYTGMLSLSFRQGIVPDIAAFRDSQPHFWQSDAVNRAE